MKARLSLRLMGHLLAMGLLASSLSCTTTYDRSGRPVKSVDPGAVAVGVVAAGLIGYALASDDDDKDRYHDPYGYHYGDHHYGRNRHCR